MSAESLKGYHTSPSTTPSTTPSDSLRRRWLPLLLLALLSGCSKEEAKPATPTEHPMLISSEMVSQQEVTISEHSVGQILTPESVTLSAESPARVRAVYADVGDRVRAGQLLAQLDAADYAAAVTASQADTARLQAQIEAQRKQVERYRALAAAKYVSPTMLDNAETQLTTLQKQLVAVQADSGRQQRNQNRTRLVAPTSGRIAERYIAAGDYIGMGKAAFLIVTNETLTVTLPFPETLSGRITTGLPVVLHRAGFDEQVHGEIERITPQVGSGSFAARLTLPNPSNWKSGGSVAGDVVVERHPTALVVPASALVLRPAGEVVYQISGNRAHERKVVSGAQFDGYAEIVSGIEAGAVVATDGASFLSDGALVEVAKKAAAPVKPAAEAVKP